jgi:hypothetical protein
MSLSDSLPHGAGGFRRMNMALKFMTVPALLAVMLRFAGNLGAEGRATLEGRRLTQPVLPH